MDKYIRQSLSKNESNVFWRTGVGLVPFNKVIRFGFKKIENIGVHFFNFILGFILSVLFLTVGMLLLTLLKK